MYLDKVNKQGPTLIDELGPCWLWTGSFYSVGYGLFPIWRNGKHYSLGAHRVSYVLKNGPIPGNLCGLHKCDNRPCVNEDHIFTGTRGDNARDAVIKKRWITKLTESQVIEIRRLYKEYDISQEALGREFGVTQGMVGQIVRGNFWTHIL